MAKITEEIPLKTYYLYDQNNNISTKMKIIYSPFNVLKEGRTRAEDNYGSDPKKVVFQGGIYETNDIEEIEFLDKWNSASGMNGARLSNGKKFWNDGTHTIVSEKPKEKQEVKTEYTEKIVEVIPRSLAEAMTHKNLVQLCDSYGVAYLEGDTKEMLIANLEKENHLRD